MSENPFIYLAEAKSADAVLPNAAAGASAVRMHRCCGVKVLYQQDFHTIYLAEAKSADAVLPKVLYQQDFHTIYLAEAKSADAVLPKVLYQQDLHTIPPARVGLL